MVHNKKIKIGYFSPDFRNHPVIHLIKDLFKYHDKSKFEIYAFSFEPEKNDIFSLGLTYLRFILNINENEI